MNESPAVVEAVPDPYRCPDCGSVFVDVAGVATCPACGFAADDPLAGAIWRIDAEHARLMSARAAKVAELERLDVELGGVLRERFNLIATMRRARETGGGSVPERPEQASRPGRAVPAAAELGSASPAATRRAPRVRAAGPPRSPAPPRTLSAQVLLVGLGAFLLVAAGVVFAAVTWERLGALGQASVLVAATVLAAGLTVLAARARLGATAEALAVVTAGFAVVDVHGARLALDPAGDGRLVWALGLSVVVAALVMLGRTARLRAPGLAAAFAAQPPLVLLASLAGASALLVAAALLVLAWADYAAARQLLGGRVSWLPTVIVPTLRVLGSLAWLGAWFVAVAAALASATAVSVGERAWSLVLLAGATAQVVAVATAAVRRGLSDRASWLAAVVAANGVLAVYGLQLLLAPAGGGEIVWACGLAGVAVGVAVLGRATQLRGPVVVAAVLAQPPVVLLAALADRSVPAVEASGAPGPTVATALVVVAWLDHLVAGRSGRTGTAWTAGAVLAEAARRALRVLGVAAWFLGALVALPWGFGLVDDAAPQWLRWWGIAVLVVAGCGAALLARAREPGSRIASVAAGATVLVGVVVVPAAAAAAGMRGSTALLASGAAGVAIAGVPILLARPRSGTEDPRISTGQATALGWAGLIVLPWLPVGAQAVVAPFVALAAEGWWGREAAVRADVLDLYGAPAGEAVSGAAPLAALVVAVAAVLVGARTLHRLGARRRTAASIAALVLGAHVFLAIGALLWTLPLTVLVALYVLGAAGLVALAVRHGRGLRVPFTVAATPFAASALAWGGFVDSLTVLVLLALAVLAGVVVARGLRAESRVTAKVATAVAGVAVTFVGLTGALVAGLVAPHAWVVAVAGATAFSAFAAVADARAAWWAPSVEATAASSALLGLVALARGGFLDPLSLALAILAFAAAAHSFRPSRRSAAAWSAAVIALMLLWLRLRVAEVHVVEPYSLSGSALLLFAGWRQMSRQPQLGSWPALGPGLLVAAVPSLYTAWSGDDIGRPLLVLGGGVVLTVLGAQLRLRSPLVVGAVTAAVIAVDQVFPVVARLPRWVTLGTAGVLLLIVGATFERRRREAKELADAYGELR